MNFRRRKTCPRHPFACINMVPPKPRYSDADKNIFEHSQQSKKNNMGVLVYAMLLSGWNKVRKKCQIVVILQFCQQKVRLPGNLYNCSSPTNHNTFHFFPLPQTKTNRARPSPRTARARPRPRRPPTAHPKPTTHPSPTATPTTQAPSPSSPFSPAVSRRAGRSQGGVGEGWAPS